MWNIYTENETILTVFLNANNENDQAYYHLSLNLQFIGHTEIIVEYQWNENLDHFLLITCVGKGHSLVDIHW